MAEINEVTAQLMRDREYWQLKYANEVRNANRAVSEREDRIEELMKQNDELSNRIHLDLDPRIKRLTKSEGELIAENDGLEDTISELRGAIKGYREQYTRNKWNRDKLQEIKRLAGSAL